MELGHAEVEMLWGSLRIRWRHGRCSLSEKAPGLESLKTPSLRTSCNRGEGPVADGHLRLGPLGWASPVEPRQPFDVTEMETHTHPTIN